MMKPETQAEVISNFQNNHRDRYALISIIMLIYFAIAIFPVLFSLKCDGYLPHAPWAALWVPLWIVDAVMLASVVLDFFVKEQSQDAEGNDIVEPTTAKEYLDKVIGLLQTVSFFLIQVFLVARLDRANSWSWFSVFAPWFFYDSLHIVALFYDSCLFEVPPPDFSKSPEPGEEEEEEEETHFQIEMEYYYSLTKQQQGRSAIVTCLLRIWFAAFLAYKLNSITETRAAVGGNWNWALVLLPVWVYIISRYYYSMLSYHKSNQVLKSLQGYDLQDPGVRGKVMYSQNLSMSCFFMSCCALVPILMSVLLVCSLEISTITTFVIILPVFLGLFVLLVCICTVWCCFSTMDVTLNEEVGGSDPKSGSYVPPESATGHNVVSSPVVIFIPDDSNPGAATERGINLVGSGGASGSRIDVLVPAKEAQLVVNPPDAKDATTTAAAAGVASSSRPHLPQPHLEFEPAASSSAAVKDDARLALNVQHEFILDESGDEGGADKNICGDGNDSVIDDDFEDDDGDDDDDHDDNNRDHGKEGYSDEESEAEVEEDEIDMQEEAEESCTEYEDEDVEGGEPCVSRGEEPVNQAAPEKPKVKPPKGVLKTVAPPPSQVAQTHIDPDID